MSTLLWAAVALAQQSELFPGQKGYQPPAVGAELYHPVVGAEGLLATEDGGENVEGTELVLRSEVGWLRQPFTYRVADRELYLLEDAVQWTTGFSLAIGRVRFGATAPVWLHASGSDYEGSATLIGDPGLDLRVNLVEGLGVAGRVTAPLGASSRNLGFDGFTGEAVVAGELQLPGELRGIANLGARFLPRVERTGLVQDDQFIVRLGLARALGPVSLAAEALGAVQPAMVDGAPLQVPVELLYSAHGQVPGGTLFLGMGHGATGSLGAGSLRVFAGLRLHGGGRPEQP